MKKAKSILASLFIVLASVLVSACSCAGGGDVPAIYVKDIEITASSTAETVKIVNDVIPSIECHVGDRFSIEYNLEPVDATITQVNWEFSDYGLVEPVLKDYTRSKSTKETVEFVAKGRTVERFTTTLTFIANVNDSGNEGTYKKAQCNITVYPKVEELPSLTWAGDNSNEPLISFNNSTNTISWKPVRNIETANGVIKQAELNNQVAVGLQSYEITKTNLDTGVTVVDLVDATKTTYSDLDTGVTYEIKVKAIGNGRTMLSSKDTEAEANAFKYYKISEAEELANDNGTISFKKPEYAVQHLLYYNGIGSANPITYSSAPDANGRYEFNAMSIFNNNDTPDLLKIAVVSYPDGYTSAGYAELDGIRYYPSTPKTVLKVQRLSTPIVSLLDTRAPLTLNGVTFTDVDENKRPHASTKVSWRVEHEPYAQEYGHSYYYEITGGNLTAPITSKDINEVGLSRELTDLDPGNYTITVKSIGNTANTISSSSKSLAFTILDDLDSNDIVLSDDFIKMGQNFNEMIGGLELFFIHQSTPDKSIRVELSSANNISLPYDISKIGLEAGQYKLYGKKICRVDINNSAAVIHSSNTQPLMSFSVAQGVSGLAMSAEGKVTFNQSTDDKISSYKITFAQIETDDVLLSNISPLTVEVAESGDVKYVKDGNGKISVDINEVIKFALSQFDRTDIPGYSDMSPDEFVKAYMNYTNTLMCQVQAKGYNDVDIINDKPAGVTMISSALSAQLKFRKSNPVTSTNLNNYNFSFNKVTNETNQRYQLSLKITNSDGSLYKEYSLEHLNNAWRTDSKDTTRIVTDLTIEDYCEVDGVDKTFAELIEPDKYHTIFVRALGFDGGINRLTTLNSDATVASYGVTSQPYDLALDQEAWLTWLVPITNLADFEHKTPEEYLNGYKYRIKFYNTIKGEGGSVTYSYLEGDDMLVNPNIVGSTTAPDAVGDEGGEDSGVEATSTTISNFITLKANVNEVLKKYPDQTIAISVEEVKSDKFTGFPSSYGKKDGNGEHVYTNYFYATKLTAPVLQYKTVDNDNQIIWASIPNATSYPISVTKAGEEGNQLPNGGDNKLTILSITNIAQTNGWSAGVYTISVVAGSSDNSTPSLEDPFVLTSEPAEITVYLVSQAFDISISETKISWNDPFAFTGYTPIYTIKCNGEDVITKDVDQGKIEYSKGVVSLDVASMFKTGENKIKITPTISFADTGVMIIGTAELRSINKWAKATDLKAQGNLTFNIWGATSESGVDFDLYVLNTEKGQYEEVSADDYSVPDPIPVNGDEENGIPPYIMYTVVLTNLTPGELTLKVVVKSEGKINSDMSDPITGTKIATVTDLTRNGDWLVWSAQPGISSYELAYKNAGADKYTHLKLIVREEPVKDEQDQIIGSKYITQWLVEGTTDTYEDLDVVNDIFYYEENSENPNKLEGKFYLKFDYSKFIDKLTGDFYFTIRPITEMPGYFSGNISDDLIITKLNTNVTVEVIDGMVTISDYSAIETIAEDNTYEAKATPNSYMIGIYEVTVTGEGESAVTTRTGKKFETGIVGYNSSIAPIDLNAVGLPGAGNYEVELTFLGNGSTSIDSNSISKLFTKLDTTTITTKEGIVVWGNPSAEVENYTLKITDGKEIKLYTVVKGTDETLLGLEDDNLEETITVPEIDPETNEEILTTTTTKYSLTNILSANQVYTLYVKANAVGKLHSEWSAPFQVKKLIAPTDLVVTRNTAEFDVDLPEDEGEVQTRETTRIKAGAPVITWNNANVTSQSLDYELKYDEKNIVEIAGITNLKYPLTTNMKEGAYTLQLRIIGITSNDETKVALLTSDYANVPANYVSDATTPKVTDGKLTWGKVAGAFSYKITATATKEGDSTPTIITLSSSTNSINFADYTALEGLDKYYGNISFTINAVTDPSDGIVSTHEDTKLDNVISLFKPKVLDNFKVKNGMLNWRVSIAEVTEFVKGFLVTTTESEPAVVAEDNQVAINTKVAEVVSYVLGKVNQSSTTEDDATFNSQLQHLLQVKLNINDIPYIDTPTSVMVVNSSGTDLSSDANEYYDTTNYLEYYYDVSIQPTIDNSGIGGGNAGDDGQVDSQTISSTRATDEPQYKAGKYEIKLQALGNSDETAPVVNGGYTNKLTAYKPSTPKTWQSNFTDIDKGRVQWGLSTTPNSSLSSFEYYEEYRVTAIPVDGSGVKTTTVSTGTVDNDNPNIIPNSNYQYFRYLKDDLFYAPNEDRDNLSDPTVLAYNTYYRLVINTIGTPDSTAPDHEGLIYLNSNSCVVGAVANILDTSANVSVASSKLTWSTSTGSTSTKVYIYGPFNNLNSDNTARNDAWNEDNVSETLLNQIYKARFGTTEDKEELLTQGLTEEQIKQYASMLRIMDFAEEDGNRISEYTMTNAIYNDDTFGAGGYVLKFQEIGDNKGIIDSAISSNYYVEKLATPKAQTGPGWVGTSASNVYVWNAGSDIWDNVEYGKQKIGTFVWDYVPGATAYHLELFTLNESQKENKDEEAVVVLENIYTRETRYDMPNDATYNKDGYLYFIRITAIRSSADKVDQLEPWFFSSDHIDTTMHYREAIPTGLQIEGTGEITWDDGGNFIGGYRIQFAHGENMSDIETEDVNNRVSFNMGDGKQAGTIAIALKTLAADLQGHELAKLNSAYTTPVEVTRLADPQARLVDGVFNWGIGDANPLTNSELYIDKDETKDDPEIITQTSGITSYKFFTDITSHTGTYIPTADTNIYPDDVHTFKVRFQGSDGVALVGDDDFFIASNLMTLKATKLKTPKLYNKEININTTSANMVMWAPVENAVGYRIRIFYSISENYTTLDVATSELIDIMNGTESNYYVVDGTNGVISNIYFNLTDVIANSGINIIDGGSLYIYVQALGSGILGNDAYPEFDEEGKQTNTLYLSSSYSNFTTVSVPPAPINIKYDSDSGILSWEVKSPDAFGIKLVNKYDLTVSEDDFNNYWRISSNLMGTSESNLSAPVLEGGETFYTPYEELISRTVIYTYNNADNSYSLNVIDTLYLPVEEVSGGYRTPSSYQLTTIASNYRFEITAVAFASNNMNQKEFTSDTIAYPGISENEIIFDRFGKGDGSEKYPYTIDNYTAFNRIRQFTDRHFDIIQDINLYDVDTNTQNLWITIAGDFTGSINGNGNTISNFVVKQITSGDTGMLALVENNKGKIYNLNVSANISDEATHNSLKVATIAITNDGTIDNVNVTGEIFVKAGHISSGDSATGVGGIVVTNNGTISNSRVNAGITALDDGSNYVFAGGIARVNYGTIYNTNFSGNTESYTKTVDEQTNTYYTSTAFIISNYVGGITATNAGHIDRCYVDNAVLYVTDDSSTTYNYKNYDTTIKDRVVKNAAVGGIASQMWSEKHNPVSITNSYSKAYIYARRATTSSKVMTIGGLVGSYTDHYNMTITNNYVITRIAMEDGETNTTMSSDNLHIYNMLLKPNNDTATLKNNYYLVENISGNLSAKTGSRNDEKVTEKGILDLLKTALKPLVDKNGAVVYNVKENDASAYPTLNPVE